MEIEKVIFLDIDGVIATNREWNMSRNAKSYIKKYDVYPFNPKCVKILNEILEEHNPVIVISSDWRLFYNMAEIADIFYLNGVKYPPRLETKNLYKEHGSLDLGYTRGKEIQLFLEENKVDKFVVIDDINMEKYFGDNFIHCTSDFEGIKKSSLKEKILNKLK